MSKQLNPIYQYTIKGNFIKEFPSVKEAAKELRCSDNAIKLVLSGKNKTTRGFRFSNEKRLSLEPIRYDKNIPIGVGKLAEKWAKELKVVDKGIITEPTSFYLGMRKLVFVGKMDVYIHPEKDVKEVIEKYSKNL